MSKHGLQLAFDTWEAEMCRRVYAETFGHMAPRRDRTYKCDVTFCLTCYGDYIVIDTNGLPSSPWMYEAVHDFAADNAGEEGEIYKFVGTFRNYVFNGSITKVTP